MDPDTRLLLVGARCASRDDAAHGFEQLRQIRHRGRYSHGSTAVLTKDAAGELQVERHGGAMAGVGVAVGSPATTGSA